MTSQIPMWVTTVSSHWNKFENFVKINMWIDCNRPDINTTCYLINFGKLLRNSKHIQEALKYSQTHTVIQYKLVLPLLKHLKSFMVDQYRGKSLGNADARREDATMEESNAGGCYCRLRVRSANGLDRCLERSNPAAFLFTRGRNSRALLHRSQQ